MKVENRIMKNKTRNIIWTVTGVLLLVGLVYASTITDIYTTNGNITNNNTGIYYNNQKTFARTADVVVCRGTSILDDYFKRFTCDVVCTSTDNDCGDDITNSIQDNKSIYISRGNYPILKQNVAIDTEYRYGILILNKTNVKLYGDGVFNLTTKNVVGKLGLILVHNSSGIKINGLRLIYNPANTADQSGLNNGLLIIDSSNIYVNEIEIRRFENFEVIIEAVSKNPTNIIIENSVFEGVGNNDIIGGGTNDRGVTNGVQPLAIKVLNNYVYHSNNLSSYLGGIVLTGATDVNFIGNTLNDSFIAGSNEKCPNNNFNIGDNKLYSNRFNNLYYGIYLTCLGVSKGNGGTIRNNDIINFNGGIRVQNIDFLKIESNLINNSVYNNFCLYTDLTDYNIINKNEFINCNSTADVSFANINNSIFSNNLIIGKQINISGGYNGLYFIGYNNSIFNNILFHNNVALSNAVYITNNNNIFSGNKINSLSQCLKVPSTGMNNTITNNIYNCGSTRYDSTTEPRNYIDDNTYTGAITSTYPCSSVNVFDQRTIYNSTNGCRCTSGSWKCWTMS